MSSHNIILNNRIIVINNLTSNYANKVISNGVTIAAIIIHTVNCFNTFGNFYHTHHAIQYNEIRNRIHAIIHLIIGCHHRVVHNDYVNNVSNQSLYKLPDTTIVVNSNHNAIKNFIQNMIIMVSINVIDLRVYIVIILTLMVTSVAIDNVCLRMVV